MNVQMVRARAGVRFLRPGQISSSFCGVRYNTTHSTRSHVQTYKEWRTERWGRVEGEESAKVERESAAAAQLRTPSGRPPAKAAPPSARGPALPLPLVRIVFLR